MAGDRDEPMPDAPAPESNPKPRRRFAPQLVEESVKSSGSSRRVVNPPVQTPEAPVSNARTTKDASVQVDDAEMANASPSASQHSRRRFAPVPIETTFDSYRVKNPHGPTAELTPEPSPTIEPLSSISLRQDEKKAEKPKRKFAPQLIETSRRTRRTGQQGPATKPTDKTDITPGTNHIYAPKTKRKHAPSSKSGNADPKDGEDDNSNPPRFVTPRRQPSMKPHPNTRRGTRNNSFHPDLDTIVSSESDKSGDEDEAEEPKVPVPTTGTTARSTPEGERWASRNYEAKNRRESCDEEFSGYLLAVAAREAQRQRELEQIMSAFPNGVRPEGVEHFFVRDNSEDDQGYDVEEPLRHGTSKLIRRKSTDPSWAVSEMRQHAEKLANLRMGSRQMSIDEELSDMDMSLPPEDPLWTTAGPRPESRGRLRTESRSPFFAASSPRVFAVDKVHTPPRVAQPEASGFRAGPFGNPFAAHNGEKDEQEIRRLRKAASPPMLGADLKFRVCPSPKVTRMEPDHPYPTHEDIPRPQDRQRDVTGQTGLWRGYCVAQNNEEMVASSLQPPDLLATPAEPTNPYLDPFATAFANAPRSGAVSPRGPAPQRTLHPLSGLDDRLRMEKIRKEKEERVLAEFDDAFITQVYNYISLGYPATARAFDDELSKISGIAVRELQRDDTKKISKGFMLEMELKIKTTGGYNGSGGGENQMRTPEEDELQRSKRPPRWQALRLYIREWARQHPDLADERNPLAWGVRARRGSWAI
ncbi:hypothetical protein BX600DRAFT_506699 [Xylariales sp. PMI_506]|nr:hypothetical protein BX600DRAFT_506699 [Xylariales sp. PMI_506]